MSTKPQDHLPSSRVTTVGGEADVSSMTAVCEDNKGAADAESPETVNIVSNSASAAAVPGAAVVAVTGFGWSPTRPQAQAPPGKVTGYSGLA